LAEKIRDLMKGLYYCRKCQNTCLEGRICEGAFPEPLIGNWQASFAILGKNPGPIDLRFKDLNEYVDHYSNHKKCGLDLKECWQIGYFLAYAKLMNPESTIDDFNRDAVILNTIKCSTGSTEDTNRIPETDLEKAKDNCRDHLIRQIQTIKPKVILSHGKFACWATIDMLRNERKNVVSALSSCNIDTLAEKNMNEISEEYVMVENEDGRKVLFFFNKHLSFCPIAMRSLEKNIEKKKRMIEDLLQAPKS